MNTQTDFYYNKETGQIEDLSKILTPDTPVHTIKTDEDIHAAAEYLTQYAYAITGLEKNLKNDTRLTTAWIAELMTHKALFINHASYRYPNTSLDLYMATIRECWDRTHDPEESSFHLDVLMLDPDRLAPYTTTQSARRR